MRVYNFPMSSSTAEVKQPKKKTGPKPRGYVRCQLLVPPEALEWAKDHPDGLSGLVRRLLREEIERQKTKAS